MFDYNFYIDSFLNSRLTDKFRLVDFVNTVRDSHDNKGNLFIHPRTIVNLYRIALILENLINTFKVDIQILSAFRNISSSCETIDDYFSQNFGTFCSFTINKWNGLTLNNICEYLNLLPSIKQVIKYVSPRGVEYISFQLPIIDASYDNTKVKVVNLHTI